MGYGTRFAEDVNSIFKVNPGSVFNSPFPSKILSFVASFDKGNIYSKFLVSKVGINQSAWEIPLIMREHSENALSNNYRIKEENSGEIGTSTLVYPLYANSPMRTNATFDTIIRSFFAYTKPVDRIRAVQLCHSNSLWYGGRGIILDRNLNILLLVTILIERGESGGFRYARTICRLSPRLFPAKDVISKGIVNKLVPFLTYEGIYPSYDYHRTVDHFERCSASIGNVSVVINSDIDKFIASPGIPSTVMCEKELQQCIVDNKQEILKMVVIP